MTGEKDLHIARTSVGIGRLDDSAKGARDIFGGDNGRALEAHITGHAANGNASQLHVILGANFIRQEFLWEKSKCGDHLEMESIHANHRLASRL